MTEHAARVSRSSSSGVIMPRTRDLGRSRQIIAERKQRQAAERWDPTRQPDRSWMKYARCKMCGFRCCVNNYSDRQIRVPRYRGVFICGSSQCKKMVPVYLYLNKRAQKGDPKAIKLVKQFPSPPYPGGR